MAKRENSRCDFHFCKLLKSFPGGPVAKTLSSQCKGFGVWSLVRNWSHISKLKTSRATAKSLHAETKTSFHSDDQRSWVPQLGPVIAKYINNSFFKDVLRKVLSLDNSYFYYSFFAGFIVYTVFKGYTPFGVITLLLAILPGDYSTPL